MQAYFFELFSGYISPGDTLIVAVSGGVDSMVLLDLILAIHDHSRIIVAHYNHHLRGIYSDEDARFVAEFCKKNNLDFRLGEGDVQFLSQSEKMSIEMTARKYRYVFLENLRIHANAKYILTAHHLDDRIETALFNLIRGTKLSGIHALAIVSNTLLRPLAAISKNTISQYALKNGILFREDLTNNDIRYLRNKIRQDILPHFEAINPEYRRNIGDFIDYTSQLKDWLDASIYTWLGRFPAGIFLISDYIQEPIFFQKEILRYIYETMNNGTIGLSDGLIEELMRFVTAGSNSYGIKNIKNLSLERRGNKLIYRKV